jgi:excisionase family DNA binding protein
MTSEDASMRAAKSAKDDPILTLSEAATELGVHRSTVERLIKAGAMPYVDYSDPDASRSTMRVRLSAVIRMRKERERNRVAERVRGAN